MRGLDPRIRNVRHKIGFRQSSLGGEHGERVALVNDRFATAYGGGLKGRH
jgi:hypothetical protein